MDHLVGHCAARNAAARARGQPPARVSGRRHERPVHAQSARAGQRTREDRGGNGTDHVDQARGRAPLHRRSIGPALHQSSRLAGRRLRHPSAHGDAHRQTQRNGLRAAQEGGRLIHEFRARLSRYKKQEPRLARRALAADPAITAAVHAHMAEHGLSEQSVRRQVRSYLNEIIPHFNVLSYYKVGYNAAKILLNLLYKVSVDYQDEPALEGIPKRDIVVYLINHRSNADYVVVAYVLARGVQVSYAVGEWARAWPLEYVFKSFGAYFVRRRFREPLYHTVLERYVQLITRNGVTQGIFPEGGLSRDGKLRPPKLGLLDYICRTLLEPGFDRDIWFVPVALNYDRVLEDRSLIRELVDKEDRPGRWSQLGTVLSYLASNTARLFTGRLKRYGRVAVNFGTPLSLRAWLGTQPADVLSRPKDARLERMDQLRDRLEEVNGKVVRGGARIADIWDRAWRMLRMRRLVLVDGESLVILPRGRPLLEYYANSIAHLVPIRGPRLPFHKAHESDPSLPRLLPRSGF